MINKQPLGEIELISTFTINMNRDLYMHNAFEDTKCNLEISMSALPLHDFNGQKIHVM